MRYALIGLALLSMSCLQDNESEDSKAHPIVGYWFACENYAPAPAIQTCDIVDDDGFYYSSDSVMRIDGAYVYAKRKMGDTNTGAFDIRVPELVFYAEREVRYGAYSIVGDTIHIDAKLPGGDVVSRESFRIGLTDGIMTIYNGNQVTRAYRKYTGKATLVTKAEWESAIE